MIKKIILTLSVIPALANAQFFENFDNSTSIPAGWSVINDTKIWEIGYYPSGTISPYYSIPITAHSGNHTASINISSGSVSGNNYLITPPITVSPGVNDFISFFARNHKDGFIGPVPSKISVKVSTTTPTANAFIYTLDDSVVSFRSAEYYRYAYDLSAFAGQTIYIGFSTATGSYIESWMDIDDINNGPLPVCDIPSDPEVITETLTSNSVKLKWTKSTTQGASYQIEYGPSGFVHGTGTVLNSSNSMVELSNLIPNTQYDFYIRANCSAGETEWTSVKSFRTKCTPLTLFPYTENFAALTLPSCWRNEFVPGGGPMTWKVATNGYGGQIPKSPPAMLRYNESAYGSKTKVLLPPLDISALSNPELKFSMNNKWSAAYMKDELRVYYKANPADEWTELGNSFSSVSAPGSTGLTELWADKSVPLPNKSSNYMIAFQAAYNYGTGVNIDDVSVVEGTSLAVDETKRENNRRVFPNPVKDIININFEEKISQVEIFSVSGQLIKSIQNNIKQINVSDLKKGVYLLKIKSGETEETFKIVKE